MNKILINFPEILCPSLEEELKMENARESSRYTIENERTTSSLGEENPLIVDEGDRRVGSRATYSCSIGRKLIGDKTRTCQSKGVWDGAKPRCECEFITYLFTRKTFFMRDIELIFHFMDFKNLFCRGIM